MSGTRSNPIVRPVPAEGPELWLEEDPEALEVWLLFFLGGRRLSYLIY